MFAKESNTNRTNRDFPFIRPVGLLRPLGGLFLGVVLGGTGGVKIWDRIFEKN